MGQKNAKKKDILPISLGGPMGPIHPVWGHLVIFGRAGSVNTGLGMDQSKAGRQHLLNRLRMEEDPVD